MSVTLYTKSHTNLKILVRRLSFERFSAVQKAQTPLSCLAYRRIKSHRSEGSQLVLRLYGILYNMFLCIYLVKYPPTERFLSHMLPALHGMPGVRSRSSLQRVLLRTGRRVLQRRILSQHSGSCFAGWKPHFLPV